MSHLQVVIILYELHVLPGRVRFKANSIYKDRALAKYISVYIDNLYGVNYSKININTATILVIYDEKKSDYNLIKSNIKKALLSILKNERRDLKNYDKYFETIEKRDKAKLKLISFGVAYISFKIKQNFHGNFSFSTNIKVLEAASVVTIIGGYPLLKTFYKKFTKHIPTDTDILLKLTALGLIIMRENSKGMFVLFLKSLSEYIKLSAEVNCIRQLGQSTRKNAGMAWLIDNSNKEFLVPVETLNIGDNIHVHTGEMIPSETIIEDGNCTVNTLYYNGQPVVSQLKKGSTAHEGITLLSGNIKAKVLEIPKPSMKPKDILENMTISKKIRRYQNNVAPISIGVAALNYILTGDMLNALSILLVLCPAASTTALNSGMRNYFSLLHKHKIYYKNPNSLEKVINIGSIVFDKTGTLTEGIMRIKEAKLYTDFYSKDELLKMCAASELDNYHPISISLQKEAKNYDISKVTNSTLIPSSGIEASFDNHNILIGNIKLMKAKNINIKIAEMDYYNFEKNLYTPILVSVDGKLCAVLVLEDIIRDGSMNLIKGLKTSGLDDIYLLTGDVDEKANNTAKSLGINNVYSECTALDKETVINHMKRKKTVMMIGDGVNDSQAMKAADISISFCSSACDKVKLHSDCIVFDDNMESLADFISLSKKSYKLMKQSIAVSELYNIFLGTMAFFGYFDAFTAKSLNTINSIIVLTMNERIKFKSPGSFKFNDNYHFSKINQLNNNCKHQ
ncbi:HAD-IC family P-type ATPase [Clostridium pasteurianum]|nr:HAD-IC family P-type ATPase [Clostridium pasteurianum]